MPQSTVFCVQLFEKRTRHAPVLGARLSVETAEEAKALATSVGQSSAAAVALCLTLDEDGKVVTTTILAKVGAVPEGWAEGLLGP